VAYSTKAECRAAAGLPSTSNSPNDTELDLLIAQADRKIDGFSSNASTAVRTEVSIDVVSRFIAQFRAYKEATGPDRPNIGLPKIFLTKENRRRLQSDSGEMTLQKLISDSL
jgi:hypothetical protein